MGFDIGELYVLYGKKSVANALKEYIKGTANTVKNALIGKKCKADMIYDEPDRVPSTFFIEFVINVVLDFKAIAEDYNDIPYKDDKEKDSYLEPSAEEPEEEPAEIPDEVPTIHEQEIPAADVSKMASQAMTRPQRVSTRKGKAIDLHAFFQEVYRKKLSSYAVSNKIRDLQRSGIFSEALGDFTISGVTINKDSDFTWLSFNNAAKGKIIRTGYVFDIESKIKTPVSEEDVAKIAQDVVPLVEKHIFIDTEYYKIVVPPVKERKPKTPKSTEPEPTLYREW